MNPQDWLRLLLEQYFGNRGFGSVADYSTPNPYNAYQGQPIVDPRQDLSLDAYRSHTPLRMNGGTPDGPLYGNSQAGAMPLSRA